MNGESNRKGRSPRRKGEREGEGKGYGDSGRRGGGRAEKSLNGLQRGGKAFPPGMFSISKGPSCIISCALCLRGGYLLESGSTGSDGMCSKKSREG